jgi:dihydrolipoamide dehydrogenase
LLTTSELGGTCLNRGCIPSKALISAAEKYEVVSHSSKEIGISAKEVEIDFTKVQEWKQGIVKKLTNGVDSLLKGNEVEVLKGDVSFVNRHTAQVNNGNNVSIIDFSHCIIATGSRPIKLPAFPFHGRALSLQASEGSVTLVGDKKTGLILGAQIVGIGASDLIAEIGLAIETGTTLDEIASTIHAHPTLGEIVMEAAEAALGHGVHSL